MSLPSEQLRAQAMAIKCLSKSRATQAERRAALRHLVYTEQLAWMLVTLGQMNPSEWQDLRPTLETL